MVPHHSPAGRYLQKHARQVQFADVVDVELRQAEQTLQGPERFLPVRQTPVLAFIETGSEETDIAPTGEGMIGRDA